MRIKLFSSALLIILAFIYNAQAQVQINSEGMFIGKETVTSICGLTLVPSEDWTINNVAINRNNGIVFWPKNTSIYDRFTFSREMAFKGNIGIIYTLSSLNGNTPKALKLAYSKLQSSNYKDYTIQKGLVDENQNFVSSLSSGLINLMEITAIGIDSALADPYSGIIANNFITPNGDGKNDTWIVQNILQFPENQLTIFDTQGRSVFSMIGYDNSWNGKMNGNPLPENTYYYVLTIDSGKSRRTGFITLVYK